MNRILENLVHVDMTIWETNPKLRNNSEIKFYTKPNNHNLEIKKGDIILANFSAEKVSVYTIEEIIDKKSHRLENRDYITARCSRSGKRDALDVRKFNTDNNSIKFKQFFNLQTA